MKDLLKDNVIRIADAQKTRLSKGHNDKGVSSKDPPSDGTAAKFVNLTLDEVKACREEILGKLGPAQPKWDGPIRKDTHISFHNGQIGLDIAGGRRRLYLRLDKKGVEGEVEDGRQRITDVHLDIAQVEALHEWLGKVLQVKTKSPHKR